MEFLKEALGEKYDEFCGMIEKYNREKPEKGLKLVNLSDGGYVEEKTYSDLLAKYEKDTSKLSDEVKKAKFNYDLELLLNAEKPKNTKALKALLDMDKIRYENGVIVGFDEQIEKLKESEGYLFGGDTLAQFSRPVGGAGGEITREDYKKLSYMDRLKLKKDAPKIFSKLKNKED